jgi:hypothetical protein
MIRQSWLVPSILLLVSLPARAAQSCVDCHRKVTPSIVTDWQLSKHSKNGIECSVCHGEEHTSGADAEKALIPTPETCQTCHPTQVEQFKSGKHAFSWASMKAMPTFHWQPMALTEGMKGCGGCHKIGLKTEAEIRELQKQGRGFGMASCDACHTRHLFSVQEARQPQASPPMGDVFSLEAWSPRPAEAIANLARVGRCTHLPNLSYARGESFGQYRVGISRCAPADAPRQTVG